MARLSVSLLGMAYLALRHHQTERAARLFAAAKEWRGTLPMTPHARAELGEQPFAEAWERGRALTIAQIESR